MVREGHLDSPNADVFYSGGVGGRWSAFVVTATGTTNVSDLQGLSVLSDRPFVDRYLEHWITLGAEGMRVSSFTTGSNVMISMLALPKAQATDFWTRDAIGGGQVYTLTNQLFAENLDAWLTGAQYPANITVTNFLNIGIPQLFHHGHLVGLSRYGFAVQTSEPEQLLFYHFAVGKLRRASWQDALVLAKEFLLPAFTDTPQNAEVGLRQLIDHTLPSATAHGGRIDRVSKDENYFYLFLNRMQTVTD